MPSEAREHEPRTALDGGADGLAIHRRIVGAATEWLASGGRLLIEVAPAQVRPARSMLSAAGLAVRHVYDGELDSTVLVATRLP